MRHNLLLQGLSGMLGKQLVVRQLADGQTLVCAAPAPSGKPRSQAQLARQQQFQAATRYARAALADPALGALYTAAAQATGRRPHNLCLADFLTPPCLLSVGPDPTCPTRLHLLVSNPVALHRVDVRLETPAGQVLAAGPAEPLPRPNAWQYTPTAALPSWASLQVYLTLTGFPGNTVQAVAIL
ncbi:hypothetical protein HER32_14900 [Hymenobacter sp. BT18]|uniref:hypothetical protein n=1 Tax=Hymenobacter sp. BT18 TaxID=2835648 RepID=UPI00143EC477|nr:hypothetical protein [Hymenobacter sp. BT18]QIX62399.1 hypothetical protein HER32_14900 [Hymenobacter sp. BT18]